MPFPWNRTFRLLSRLISKPQEAQEPVTADPVTASPETVASADTGAVGTGMAGVTAKEAIALISKGEAPENLEVAEPLEIRTWSEDARLPDGLRAPSILVQSKKLPALPARLTARRISARSDALKTVGPGLRCDVLDLRETAIETLPAGIEVRQRLELADCRALSSLPDNIATGSLNLSGCVSLRALPAGLRVAFLDLTGCLSLRALPDDLRINGGHLVLRNCQWLTRLPDDLGNIAGLDLSGCLNLTSLPEGLQPTSWIDLAGTGITELPARLDHVGLRWRGIPVSRRIVFHPETLSAGEILGERNAELRRVMIERFGYERLLEATRAEELDRDSDPGGERRLLRIPIEGDEDIVCVSVQCPSTGHKFILRVPPTTQTCRQAIAWTAGYDNPDEYAPVIET